MLHPLSLLPSLFSYPFLAYFILRITVAFSVLCIGGTRRKKSYAYLAYADFLAGILVLIGLYTQGALIVIILLLIKEYYLDWKAGILDGKEKTILTLICAISIALLFLGPGSFALDLPL